MLEVAPHAVPAIGILHPEKRVVALMRGQPVGDFLMAFEALERRRAGSELVAGVALGRAVEGLVRFGEGTGRNLGAGPGRAEQDSDEQQQGAKKPRRRIGPDTGALNVGKKNRHRHPPTNHFLRIYSRQLESKLARTMFRHLIEPTSCAFQGKLS